MTKNRPKILFIQVRPEQIIADHEYQCFKCALKRASCNLYRINVCFQKLSLYILKDFDAVIIGGSSFSIRDKFPQKNKVLKLIENIIKNKKSFLGVCFGFQLLIEVLGGKLKKDLSQQEFGTFMLKLTKTGIKDKLFSFLPKSFHSQQGHQWSTAHLPKNVELLAQGNKCLIQAIKVKDSNIYGVQFHPELTKKNMIERVNLYAKLGQDSYIFNKNLLKESLEAFKIISRFVDLISPYP